MTISFLCNQLSCPLPPPPPPPPLLFLPPPPPPPSPPSLLPSLPPSLNPWLLCSPVRLRFVLLWARAHERLVVRQQDVWQKGKAERPLASCCCRATARRLASSCHTRHIVGIHRTRRIVCMRPLACSRVIVPGDGGCNRARSRPTSAPSTPSTSGSPAMHTRRHATKDWLDFLVSTPAILEVCACCLRVFV